MSTASTGHLLSDWLGGKHVLLLVAMNQNNKYMDQLYLAAWKKATGLQVYGCKHTEYLLHFYTG